MQTSVSIGQSLNYALEEALLIYNRKDSHHHGSQTASIFLTRHAVKVDSEGVPSLGPASLVDLSFLKAVVADAQGALPAEIIPENVLMRTATSLCWWTPAAQRVMYYMKDKSPELSKLSGSAFPQPPLLFLAQENSLQIRALAAGKRPQEGTKLFRAPYWNVDNDGRVCLGSTRIPDSVAMDSMARWEAPFFESEFTHANGNQRLTAHPEGFAALWSELKGVKVFPAKYLASAGETVQEFLAT